MKTDRQFWTRWRNFRLDEVSDNVVNERNPDSELYTKLGKIETDIVNVVKRYEKIADAGVALNTFMMGLHSKLAKMGYKGFKK